MSKRLMLDETELGRVGGDEDRKVTRHILQDCVDLLLRTLTIPQSEVKAMEDSEQRRDMI